MNFEGIKSIQHEQRNKFNGMPFFVLRCKKNMDCAHGKDHATSRKIKVFPDEFLLSYF